MDSIKSPLIIVGFSILTCVLLLTQVMIQDRDEPPVTTQPVNQQLPEVFPPDTERVLYLPARTKHMTGPGMAVASLQQQPDVYYSLYPELDQISRLEDENLLADQVIDRLQPLIQSTDPVVRLAALRSIGEINHSSSQSVLFLALNDPEPLIRINAIENLTRSEDGSVLKHIEPLIFDADKAVRISAINALGDLESEQAVQALAAVLSDEDADIRNSAVNALGEIGGDAAALYLNQLKYDNNKTIRANAITILDELSSDAGSWQNAF